MSAERFDCCSSHIKCSDALECIYKGNPIFEVCTYRKKLEAGIVFYGKNANVFEPIKNGILPTPVKKVETVNSKPKVYLTCYKRPFLILRRSNIWSYKLDAENAKIITDEFTSKAIPYTTNLEILEDLPGDEIEITGPYNSRVVFKTGESEFHILNFNTYLMQNWYADKINKSLNAKGFESRVELIGPYAKGTYEVESITKRDMQQFKTAVLVKPEIKTERQQLTLFDLMDFSAPMRRR